MTLYNLLSQISQIITPEDNSFYNYALYTSDDNGGFLRTRYCWWLDRPVEDRELGEGYEVVLVTAKRPIEISDFLDQTETRFKMQVSYSTEHATAEDADWDAQLDYCYIYLFDLINKTYTTDYMKNPLDFDLNSNIER